MTVTLQLLAAAGLVALPAGVLVAPFVFKWLQKAKSQQNVSAHLAEHQHKQGTPTMGGLMILIPLLVGMCVFVVPTEGLQGLAPLVLLLGFGLVGFLDDYVIPKRKPGSRGLDWKPKLGLEIASSIAAAFFMGTTNPLHIAIFVFFVLFFSNAFNFADGLDTLAGGIGILMALGFFLLVAMDASWFKQVGALVPVGWVMALLFFSFWPFMFYNAPPARVFMGDVGALPIGALFGWAFSTFLISALAGSSTMTMPMVGGAAIISILMLVELIPVPLQVASVKLRGKRMFPFKTPVHHAFQEKGWPETRIVWMFHLAQATLLFVGLGVAALLGGPK